MLNKEEVKQVMYQIFNETDATRDKLIDSYNRVMDGVDIPASYICRIETNLLLTRINEATSVEECRGYITELITCLSVFRLILDEALGISHGSNPQATNAQPRSALQPDLPAI
jgi:hypothetical protein